MVGLFPTLNKNNMTNSPLVSIIIPVYNGTSFTLSECVKTAINQKYKNKEIIIVNDSQNNKTYKDLEKFKESNKIKLVKNRKNRGLASSLNKGINLSRGEYVVSLLQDCIPYSTNWLSELVALANNKKVVAVCSRVKNDLGIWKKQEPIVRDLTKSKLGFYSPLLDEKGCLYKKKYLEKVGLFDEKNFKFAGEDYDMYYKLSKEGIVLNNVKPYVFHKHFFDLDKLKWTKSIYGFSFGRLFRIYGMNLKGWFNGVILMNMFPIWGILKGIKTNTKFENKLKIIKICIELNWIYMTNFIKGSLLKSK